MQQKQRLAIQRLQNENNKLKDEISMKTGELKRFGSNFDERNLPVIGG